MVFKYFPIISLTLILSLISCETKEDSNVFHKIDDLKKGDSKFAKNKKQDKDDRFKILPNEKIFKCYHDNLSKQFDIDLKVKHTEDSAAINISILDKKSLSMLTELNIQSGYLGSLLFTKCNEVRSYTAGINKNKEVVDNSFGDFVVADFNFDGLDDLAVAIDMGGNGGYIYRYYLQTDKHGFNEDKFLSQTMIFFPTEFNKQNKTLKTIVHASAGSVCESKYKFYNGSWQEVERKFVGI